MTLNELILELKKVKDNANYDRQDSHLKADELLLKYINSKDVRRAFLDIEKWYA